MKGMTRRHLQLMRGTMAVVVAAIVVIVVTSGSHATPIIRSPETPSPASVITSLIKGIPQSGNTLGASTAPVTLKYFADLEGPVSRNFSLSVLPALVEKYVRTGKMRIEYLSLETATQAPKVFETQQIAAYAAGKQGKAWYFIQLFYSEQGERDSGYVTESYLQDLAKQVPGLNLEKWTAERSDPELAAEVEMDARAGNAAGFRGSASFLLGKTGGTFKPFAPGEYTEAAPYESAVESLLKS